MNKKEQKRLWSENKRKDPVYREQQRVFYREWYAKNKRNRSPDYIECIKDWRQKNPEKSKTAMKLAYYVRRGYIIKPKTCSICKRETRILGHHEDYSKPYEVVWLCYSCHKLKHNHLTKLNQM